jgi:hypothetical protein
MTTSAKNRFVSRLSGDQYEVTVREEAGRRHLSRTGRAGEQCAPPFAVEDGAAGVSAVNELPRLGGRADRYVIIGAGKTAIDGCLWLLQNGVDPRDIRWIKPREPWLLNRGVYSVRRSGGET